ncbi:LamG-like jellyroll fold domain-containing protein [Azospirillum picis]|uniref:Uncharacterized protein n=1 Tax=Azospirillum picis TaxID=488438 RepID=A0ABU0MUT7_9PROT|nr:LamG-like jellyroll fold domain-containing protein [Azospirillum picis]MBP2303332.1 hypothetical protein [Azospirillum picis]MDQ0537186.1 hypothetical protein [Azospirillum picis]
MATTPVRAALQALLAKYGKYEDYRTPFEDLFGAVADEIEAVPAVAAETAQAAMEDGSGLLQQFLAAAQQALADGQSAAAAAAASASAAAGDRGAAQTALAGTEAARSAAAGYATQAQQWVGSASNVVIAALSKQVLAATTLVDCCVYDTRQDTDGGAWIDRCGWTSWENELLNTANRGARRKFPVVALIVAEQTKLTIYDALDLDANGAPRMWMVVGNSSGLNFGPGSYPASCVTAKNGHIYIGTAGTAGAGLYDVCFTADLITRRFASGASLRQAGQGIGTRNVSVAETIVTGAQGIVNANVNGLDCRVLPGAPLDAAGLPVPTVAVATAGGVSVIRHDGNVWDITYASGYSKVAFISDNRIACSRTSQGAVFYGPVPTSDMTESAWRQYYIDGGTSSIRNIANSFVSTVSPGALGQTSGLTFLSEDITTPANGMVAYATTSYATGWMPGDIRGAWLCDGATGAITGSTELVSNGTFTTDTSGWTAENAIIASVGGKLEVTATASSGAPAAVTTIAVSSGLTYTVSVELEKVSGRSSPVLQIAGAPVSSVTSLTQSTTGTVMVSTTFTTISSGSVSLRFYEGNASAPAGLSFRADNVSVKSGELIANGGFDTDTSGWTARNGAALSVVSGRLRVTSPGTSGAGAYRTFSTTPGQTYTLSFDYVAGNVNYYYVDVTNADQSAQLAPAATGTSTSASSAITFQATTTQSVVRLFTTTVSGQYTDYDNVSCRLATPDRSYRGKGLIVNGTLQRNAVNGGDVVAWSGFNANNSLEQPAGNPDLNFGTGDFYVRAWVSAGGLVDRFLSILDPNGKGFAVGTDGAGNFAAVVTPVSGGTLAFVSTAPLNGANFRQAILCRRAGVLELWADGTPVYSAPNSTDLSIPGAVLRVGCLTPGSGDWDGKIAMVGIGAYAPSPAQIAKMYADERGYFDQGAKAFLGGTSNAVQSLSFDDATGKLAVATGDGVSVFAGLRRIDYKDAAGVAVGSELVTNGRFDTTSSGWSVGSAGAGSYSAVSGELRSVSSGVAGYPMFQTISVTPGKTYLFCGQHRVGTAPVSRLRVRDGATATVLISVDTSSTSMVDVIAAITPTQSSITVEQGFVGTPASGQTMFLDNVSVRELGAISNDNIKAVSLHGDTLLIGTSAEAGIITQQINGREQLAAPRALPPPNNDPTAGLSYRLDQLARMAALGQVGNKL